MGQPVSYLAASAWNHDETLPLVGSTDPGNPPGRWVGQMRSQQAGVYQVHLMRLDLGWCPAIDGGYGVDGEARQATSPCLGGELVP